MMLFFFFKQKTAYELRISDWSSDVCSSDLFKSGACITRFIDTTPELFVFTPRRDRATKLLRIIGEVIVNGNPEMKGREPPKLPLPPPRLPCRPRKELALPPPAGTRDILIERGPDGFAQWMMEQKQIGRDHVATTGTNAHIECSL